MNARRHRRPQRLSRGRRGFTLIEVLLVAGIIVMLAAIVVPNMLGSQEQANIKAAKINVLTLSKAFDQFKFTYDQPYPAADGFNVLATGAGANVPNFQPLLESATQTDPWNRPYNYQFPPQHNKIQKPDIWSNGPDGQSGTADDVGNWPAGQ
jgi:general secretion pathway protein G